MEANNLHVVRVDFLRNVLDGQRPQGFRQAVLCALGGEAEVLFLGAVD